MNRLYLKLVRYFIGLMMVTCLASLILFFFTLGSPMAKDFHRMLRNNIYYIGWNIENQFEQGGIETDLGEFITQTARTYGVRAALLDVDLSAVEDSGLGKLPQPEVSEMMLSMIVQKGIFVQPSHYKKPLIYVLPIKTTQSGSYYLYIEKQFPRTQRGVVFFSGLVLLLGLLVLAIYPLARSFTNPLVRVTEAVRQIADGNLKPEIGRINRKDEFGDLLNGFMKMAESVENMIASRKTLLADISHELRSPLARLGIAAELIRSEAENPDGAASILRLSDDLEYEILQMDTLLRQLSDYAVLNLPDVQMKTENLLVSDFLSSVHRRYFSMAEKDNILLSLHLPAGNQKICVDQAKMFQVFCNLMDNAFNVCPENGEIEVGWQLSVGEVEMFVGNTGKEIPDHLTEKIFDPLFRTDPSRTRTTGGSGLGLAIAKKIVEHHGGRVCVARNQGKTVFSVYIPF